MTKTAELYGRRFKIDAVYHAGPYTGGCGERVIVLGVAGRELVLYHITSAKYPQFQGTVRTGHYWAGWTKHLEANCKGVHP